MLITDLKNEMAIYRTTANSIGIFIGMFKYKSRRHDDLYEPKNPDDNYLCRHCLFLGNEVEG